MKDEKSDLQDMDIRPWTPALTADLLTIANSYLAGWPYTRPIDADLVATWPRRPEFQSEHILLAYREGRPCAFAHGQRRDGNHLLHLVAFLPDALLEAVALLQHIEAAAREDGVSRICGPSTHSAAFYGGYVLGCEPYHPHWAALGTDLYTSAGYRMSQLDTLMICRLDTPLPAGAALPEGFRVVEAKASPEYGAEVLCLEARCDGALAARAGARVYTGLPLPNGRIIGQVGPVNTEEAYRGKGLAKLLTAHALSWMRDRGADEALISTGFENIPALRAYERVGFVRRELLTEWSKSLAPAPSSV